MDALRGAHNSEFIIYGVASFCVELVQVVEALG
jgi:hypothetical protein